MFSGMSLNSAKSLTNDLLWNRLSSVAAAAAAAAVEVYFWRLSEVCFRDSHLLRIDQSYV